MKLYLKFNMLILFFSRFNLSFLFLIDTTKALHINTNIYIYNSNILANKLSLNDFTLPLCTYSWHKSNAFAFQF